MGNNPQKNQKEIIKKEIIKGNRNYKIIKKLGEGGFGSVQLILINNKSYALKIIKNIDKNDINKYEKESKILSSLNSKYIVKYYDSYFENDNYYILMEYAGDSNLKTYIKSFKDKNQLIEENIIEKIIRQICLGLKKIHKNKIIHRDLKPENIFINEKNEIKIGDFGISKNIESKIYASTIIGTERYMAPEIIKKEKYNNKVDIYSLGCILYELFTLNEYYIDKIIDNKEGKINQDIYKEKWQNLIDLLVKKEHNERPDIKEVYNYIIDYSEKNEILLNIKIEKNDVGKKTYFLNENSKLDINDIDSIVYINNTINESNKYFIPKKEGIYKIKLILFFSEKDFSEMFFGCENLLYIDLSSFDTKNVTNMNSMFYGCENLENINLSSFVTKNVTNMNNLFYGCKNLKIFDLSSFDTKNVINMNNMFYGCENLEEIKSNEISFQILVNYFPELKNKINISYEEQIENLIKNYYKIDKNDFKIFNEYKYYFPYYPYICYLEYPFIKDEKFYEVNISYFEYIEINGIKKEIFENKSFNKKELKKKFEEKIEKISVPTIKLDEIKKNFGEEIIKKFLNFKTIYEKKAKKTNNIIIQLNYLSTLIYEIFVELVINSEDKIPEYRGSYLESIGFSQSCEKFNQYYSCVNNFVNKFLFNKKFIIYLKKK